MPCHAADFSDDVSGGNPISDVMLAAGSLHGRLSALRRIAFGNTGGCSLKMF